MSRFVRRALPVLMVIVGSCATSSGPGASDDPESAAVSVGYHPAQTIAVDGSMRSYDLYVPEFSDDTARPLVLLFHGQRGNAGQLMGRSGRGAAPFSTWLGLADEAGLVLAIPNGSEGTDGHTGWNDCRNDATSNPTVDDVAFVDALIDEVDRSLPIDRDRVVATGISNGGHFSLRLAIERPDLIAGVAPIAAAMPADSLCREPTQPVPVLFINGTDDPFLPFDGGAMPSGRGTVLSASDSMQFWADLNPGDPDVDVARLPDTATDDGSTVVAHRSSIGAAVWLYEVIGGGHTEPSISERYSRVFKRVVGSQNGDIEAAREIWEFFDTTG